MTVQKGRASAWEDPLWHDVLKAFRRDLAAMGLPLRKRSLVVQGSAERAPLKPVARGEAGTKP